MARVQVVARAGNMMARSRTLHLSQAIRIWRRAHVQGTHAHIYCIALKCAVSKVYCIVSYRIVSYCIILFILLYAAGRVDVCASTSITAHCAGPKQLQQAAYRELQKAAFGYDSAVALGYNSVAAPAEDNEPVPMAL